MPATRPSPMTTSALTARTTIQIGTKAGEKCTVRFALGNIDADKTWRTISLYPPADSLEGLMAFDLENDGLNNITKTDDNDRQYINVKVRVNRTKCKSLDGDKVDLSELAPDDACIVVVKPVNWKYDGNSGVALRAVAVIVCEDDASDIDIL